METFKVKSFGSNEITLIKSEDVPKLYNLLASDEAIQLEWMEGNQKKSQVLITASIAGKVKSGEVVLKSEEGV